MESGICSAFSWDLRIQGFKTVQWWSESYRRFLLSTEKLSR